MTELKPLKAPQETLELSDLDDLNYPVFVSFKLDGIRCIVKDGKVLSSSMRELPNVQIRKLLTPLLKKKSWVFDGELYGHNIEFGDISGACRRKDSPLPRGLIFNIFDCMRLKEWNGNSSTTFRDRHENIKSFIPGKIPYDTCKRVVQGECQNRHDIERWINNAKSLGYEGIMVRDPEALYKHGRASVKQNIIRKYKFWEHFDARILSVHEMRGIKEGVERVLEPTGRTRAVHKKGDKEGKGTFGYFMVEVDMPGKPTMQIGNWKGCTHELRAEIWANPEPYIGQWVRFEAMSVGQKDVPRIPKNVEFRDAK